MLTAHFALAEFASRDGQPVPDDLLLNVRRLAGELEVLRRFLRRPIIVVSGYRSPSHNAAVKGVEKSQHLLAKAADVRVFGLTPGEVHGAIMSLILRGRMNDGGVGTYATWLHYDTARPRRWKG